MAIELIYEKLNHKESYRLNDSLTNISTGVLQQLTNTFIALFNIGIYTWVYHRFSIEELGQSTWTFILALLLWDLCYYWEHRMAHSVNLFWGGHVVHHQSEEYNLSVALRQTSTGFIWGFPFFLPMALLGIHPIQFVLVGGINLLYQFWIHTEHIKKLPRVLEYIFNTPSHHRVHHGRDPKYIDKNYAGIFIFWDRLFNTFQKEEERPHYGITNPINSWNPVYANFSHYIQLSKWLQKVRSPKDAFLLLFKKPGWFPSYMGGQQTVKELDPSYSKFDKKTEGLQYYILLQFLIALALSSFYFFQYSGFGIPDKSIFALWIVFSTLIFGLMFEYQNKWLIVSEIVRLSMIPWIMVSIIFSDYQNLNLIWMVSITLVLISMFLFINLIRNNSRNLKALDY